jgi:receptor-type tyrosine-protein phosphatase epsilon
MLTNLIEKGMERCAQYWPDQYNVPYIYGDIEVTLIEYSKNSDYIKRIFQIKSKSVRKETVKKEQKLHIVTQYFYPEWPDRDTPTTDAMSLLHLVRDVNKNHQPHEFPIVVHCSAGVGRTGTYITLDAMYEQLNKESKFNSFDFIKKIREQRQYLVQTSKQYVFIHEALYEYCVFGFTDVESTKLVQHYKHLRETPNALENEFKVCT